MTINYAYSDITDIQPDSEALNIVRASRLWLLTYLDLQPLHFGV